MKFFKQLFNSKPNLATPERDAFDREVSSVVTATINGKEVKAYLSVDTTGDLNLRVIDPVNSYGWYVFIINHYGVGSSDHCIADDLGLKINNGRLVIES